MRKEVMWWQLHLQAFYTAPATNQKREAAGLPPAACSLVLHYHATHQVFWFPSLRINRRCRVTWLSRVALGGAGKPLINKHVFLQGESMWILLNILLSKLVY